MIALLRNWLLRIDFRVLGGNVKLKLYVAFRVPPWRVKIWLPSIDFRVPGSDVKLKR